MRAHIARLAIAVVTSLALDTPAHGGWYCCGTFSTADGSVQFVTLSYASSVDVPYVPITGQTLAVSDGKTERSFTFPGDPGFSVSCTYDDGCSNYASVLVATPGFAALNAVKPDFVVPDGFLFLPGGSVRLGSSAMLYNAVPVHGTPAAEPINSAFAINSAGAFYDFVTFDGLPVGVNSIVEYHNADLDDYFLTAYPDEIQALDSRDPPDWKRTGHSFAAWTSTYTSVALSPSNTVSVCRVWLGDSHYYSTSWSECLQVARRPGATLETQTAFLAVLPDAETGACPAGQTRFYRLWNPRGSSHRYTTETQVRDEMLTRGWIAEGYGPDNVAMCVGGSR